MLISSEAEVVMKDYFGYTILEDGTVFTKRHPDRIKRPHRNSQGYLFHRFQIDGKPKTKGVHRVVAECYVPNPDNLPEVDHKDANKDNNHYSNLQWVTRGENIRKTYEQEGRSATGINNARCITTEETVHEVCTLLQEGYLPKDIRGMGYDYCLARHIKTRKNWRHISKDYNF